MMEASSEILDIRTLITVIGVIASISSTWAIMSYKISELKESDKNQQEEIKTLRTRINEVQEENVLDSQKLNVISGMLRPERVAEHTTAHAHIEKDIEYLRRDVDELHTLIRKNNG